MSKKYRDTEQDRARLERQRLAARAGRGPAHFTGRSPSVARNRRAQAATKTNFYIRDDLFRRLRIYCTGREVPMTLAIEELIEEGIPDVRIVQCDGPASGPGPEQEAA